MTQTKARALWIDVIQHDPEWSARLLRWYTKQYPKYLARKKAAA